MYKRARVNTLPCILTSKTRALPLWSPWRRTNGSANVVWPRAEGLRRNLSMQDSACINSKTGRVGWLWLLSQSFWGLLNSLTVRCFSLFRPALTYVLVSISELVLSYTVLHHSRPILYSSTSSWMLEGSNPCSCWTVWLWSPGSPSTGCSELVPYLSSFSSVSYQNPSSGKTPEFLFSVIIPGYRAPRGKINPQMYRAVWINYWSLGVSNGATQSSVLLLPSSLLWEPFLTLRVAAHLLINNLLRRALGIPSLLLHGNN